MLKPVCLSASAGQPAARTCFRLSIPSEQSDWPIATQRCKLSFVVARRVALCFHTSGKKHQCSVEVCFDDSPDGEPFVPSKWAAGITDKVIEPYGWWRESKDMERYRNLGMSVNVQMSGRRAEATSHLKEWTENYLKVYEPDEVVFIDDADATGSEGTSS